MSQLNVLIKITSHLWGFLLNNFFLYFYTKLNLQKLILILIFICTSILFITSILILNYIVKEQLIQSSLLNNQKYATKIALTTDKYFESMLDEMINYWLEYYDKK